MKLLSADANANEWSEKSAAPVPSSPWDSSAKESDPLKNGAAVDPSLDATDATPALDETPDYDDDDDSYDDDDHDDSSDEQSVEDDDDARFVEEDYDAKFDEEDYGPAAGREAWQLQKLDEKYLGEDVNAAVTSKGESLRMPAHEYSGWGDAAVNARWGSVAPTPERYVSELRTRYLGPDEQARLDLHADKLSEADGQVDRPLASGAPASGRAFREPGNGGARLRTADGKLADTSAAISDEGYGTDQKNMFVMTPNGALRAADPRALRQEEAPMSTSLRGGCDADKQARAVRLALADHSSLAAVPHHLSKVSDEWSDQLAPGKVAGAGQLRLSDGRVDEVSDESNQYQQNNQMTAQVLGKLKAMDVDLYDTTVKLTNKRARGQDKSANNLYASAREFEAATAEVGRAPWRADALEQNLPEAIMRDRRERLGKEIGASEKVRDDEGAEARSVKIDNHLGRKTPVVETPPASKGSTASVPQEPREQANEARGVQTDEMASQGAKLSLDTTGDAGETRDKKPVGGEKKDGPGPGVTPEPIQQSENLANYFSQPSVLAEREKKPVGGEKKDGPGPGVTPEPIQQSQNLANYFSQPSVLENRDEKPVTDEKEGAASPGYGPQAPGFGPTAGYGPQAPGFGATAGYGPQARGDRATAEQLATHDPAGQKDGAEGPTVETRSANLPAPSHVPNLPMALRPKPPTKDSPYKTGGILPKYDGEQEDAKSFRGLDGWSTAARTPNADVKEVVTRYLSPIEQKRHELGVKNGLLQTPDGKRYTSTASGTGTANFAAPGSGPEVDGVAGKRRPGREDAIEKDKHIFVMTPSGTIRALDPWAHHTEEQIPDEAEGAIRMGFVNHSSLAADVSEEAKVDRKARPLQDGKVAAAGELQGRDGKLEAIGDASGHYAPDHKMTAQAIERLQELGVDTHDTALKLTNAHTKVNTKTKQVETVGNLHASVREFQEARKQHPANPAALMSARKEDLKAKIKAAAEAREKRSAAREMQMTTTPRTKKGGPGGSEKVKRRRNLLDPRLHEPLLRPTREERRQKLDEMGPEKAREAREARAARRAARVQEEANASLFEGYAS